jgi:hypothetical protein
MSPQRSRSAPGVAGIRLHIMFEVRRVREHDVLFVLMRDKRNLR